MCEVLLILPLDKNVAFSEEDCQLKRRTLLFPSHTHHSSQGGWALTRLALALADKLIFPECHWRPGEGFPVVSFKDLLLLCFIQWPTSDVVVWTELYRENVLCMHQIGLEDLVTCFYVVWVHWNI